MEGPDWRRWAWLAIALAVGCSRNTPSQHTQDGGTVVAIPTATPGDAVTVAAAEKAKSRVEAAIAQNQPECAEAERATTAAKTKWKAQQDIIDRQLAAGREPSRAATNAARALRLAFDNASGRSALVCNRAIALRHFLSICDSSIGELRTAVAPSRASLLVSTVGEAADRAEEVVGKVRSATLQSAEEAQVPTPIDKAVCPGAARVVAVHSRGCVCNEGAQTSEIKLAPACKGAIAVAKQSRCEADCTAKK